MDTEGDNDAVFIILLDASEHQKVCGRGRKPNVYDIKKPRKDSCPVPFTLWCELERTTGLVIPPYLFCALVVCVAAFFVPLCIVSDMDPDKMSLTANILLGLYLAGMLVPLWIIVRKGDAITLETRQANVAMLQEPFQQAGFDMEFGHEKWDCCSYTTFVRLTSSSTAVSQDELSIV